MNAKSECDKKLYFETTLLLLSLFVETTVGDIHEQEFENAPASPPDIGPRSAVPR